MTKVTGFAIFVVGGVSTWLASGLIRTQAVWWSWAGVVVVGLALTLWLCGRAEKRAKREAQRRAEQHVSTKLPRQNYMALPLAPDEPQRPNGRVPYTYRQGRK